MRGRVGGTPGLALTAMPWGNHGGRAMMVLLLLIEGGWWCVYLVRGAGGVAAAIFLGPPLLCEQTGSGSAVQGLGLPCKVFHASTKCKCDVYCISMPTVSYGVTYNLKKWPTCMEGRWLWA